MRFFSTRRRFIGTTNKAIKKDSRSKKSLKPVAAFCIKFRSNWLLIPLFPPKSCIYDAAINIFLVNNTHAFVEASHKGWIHSLLRFWININVWPKIFSGGAEVGRVALLEKKSFSMWFPIHAGCFDRLTRLSTCDIPRRSLNKYFIFDQQKASSQARCCFKFL